MKDEGGRMREEKIRGWLFGVLVIGVCWK